MQQRNVSYFMESIMLTVKDLICKNVKSENIYSTSFCNKIKPIKKIVVHTSYKKEKIKFCLHMALYDYLRGQNSHLSLTHLNINGLPAQRSVCFCED